MIIPHFTMLFPNNQNSYMSNTPYCRTCHKAGKSYNEYTNHWTRDTPGKDGNITCPVILNTICNYCKQKGHWLKFCPSLSAQPVESESYSQPLNSWANILKRGGHNLSTSELPHYDFMNVDVSVCDVDVDVEVDEISRPPSPNYPPPTDSSRPPSPNFPPPTSYL